MATISVCKVFVFFPLQNLTYVCVFLLPNLMYIGGGGRGGGSPAKSDTHLHFSSTKSNVHLCVFLLQNLMYICVFLPQNLMYKAV